MEINKAINFNDFVLSNKDLRIERDKFGTITIHQPSPLNIGFFEEEILYFLKHWSRNNPSLGKVFSPSTSFNLPDGSQYKADGAWISSEKLAKLSAMERKSIAAVVPDFIIETRSQTDNLINLKRKMQNVWMANGVKLAWLFDPKLEKVWIYRAGQNDVEEISEFNKLLSGEDVLPDFELNLGNLLKAED